MNILEQVSHFNYFRITITFKKYDDVFQKLNMLYNICGTSTRKIKSRKETLTKFCKVTALAVLMHGGEDCLLRKEEY